MNYMNKARTIIANLFQFLPLSVFTIYSFRTGVPSQERLFTGFMIGAVVAVIQLIWLLRQQRPANRLILGANLWLIIGGAAVYFQLWGVLKIYREMREAGLLASMLAIGIVTTLLSPAGYIGNQHADAALVRKKSCLLLLATVSALLCGLYFRGNTLFAAVIPIIILTALNRFFYAGLAQPIKSDIHQEESSCSS